jgi:uncharacterized protein (DUF1499 family)
MSMTILFSVLSRIENWKRDLTTNFAKLDPESDDPLLRPLVLPHPVQDAAAMIEQWAEAQPHWSVESRKQTESETTIQLSRRTRLLRFRDDIHVRLLPDGDATRVEAESQSRWGIVDLGQNPRNLRELASALGEHR